jgi:hypothetical protein
MTEGINQGSKGEYYKLYTHQRARLIQLEEENKHLRSVLGDVRKVLVAWQAESPSSDEGWQQALITLIDAAPVGSSELSIETP